MQAQLLAQSRRQERLIAALAASLLDGEWRAARAGAAVLNSRASRLDS